MFKDRSKKIISCVLALSMICAAFATVILPSSAAETTAQKGTGYTSATQVEYVTETTYVLNWGYQGESCEFLSIYANEFYAGDYTYDELSQLEGGTFDDDAAGSNLYNALNTLMNPEGAHITKYDETQNLYKYTDCQLSDSSTIFLFYSGRTYSSAWNGSTWNQEHIWPYSKCITYEKGKTPKNDSADIIMLRPAHQPENSGRNDTAYGESEGYFEPMDSLKGDCARTILYYATRWGKMSKLVATTDSEEDKKAEVIESIDILLEWMALDPVDTFEMGRNDAVQSITGTRNVFVDYPELAWQMFGKKMPADAQTPSDNDGKIEFMTIEQKEYSSAPTVSGGKYTYTFADYLGGLYIAKNETHVMDENLTLYTDEAHFTTELRLYQSTTGRSKAIFETKDYIHSVSIEAGGNVGRLKISASKDGENWVLIDKIDTTAAYKSHNVDITAGACQYLKIESTGAAIKLKSVTFKYGDKVSGAELVPLVEDNTSNTPVGSTVRFELGSDTPNSRYDGSSATAYEETKDGYTLSISDGETFYIKARDAKGNGCLKLGKANVKGSCCINVPEGVKSVIIHAAQYNASENIIIINGTSYTLTNSASEGLYDTIEVEVPSSGKITVSTTDKAPRCMINALEFVLDVEEETTEEETNEEETTEAEETTPEEDTTEEETTTIEETTTVEEITTVEESATVEETTTTADDVTNEETEAYTETEHIQEEQTEEKAPEKDTDEEDDTSISHVGGEDSDDDAVKIEGGCASTVGTGSAVIITLWLAGVMFSRKKKE